MAGAVELPIRAVITAVDRATATIRHVAGSVRGQLGTAFEKLNTTVGAGIRKMADWATGAAAAGAAAGVALAGGVVMAGRAYLETAGRLEDMTQQLKVGAEFLQELEYTAKQSGIGVEEMDSAIAKLSRNVGAAKLGMGPLFNLLKHYPILLAQLKNTKGTEDAFELLFAAMAKIEDPGKRALFASQAFGKSGVALARFADGGIEALDKLRAEARATGSVMSQAAVDAGDNLGDSLDRLKASVEGVGVSIGAALVPQLQPLVDSAIAWVQANRDVIAQDLVGWFEKAGSAIASVDWGKVLQGVQDLAGMISTLHNALGGFKTEGGIFAALLGVKIVTALWSLKPVILAIVSAVTWLAGAFATAASTISTILYGIAYVAGASVGTVVAAFALIPTAIYLVATHLQDFVEFGQEFWRSLKVLWIDGTGWLAGLWDLFVDGWNKGWASFAEGVRPLWQGVVDVFNWAWGKIKAVIDGVRGGLETVAGMLPEWAGGTVTHRVEGAPNGASGPPVLSAPTVNGGPQPLSVTYGAGTPAKARVDGEVRVTFDNAPPGLRAVPAGRGGVGITAEVGRRSLGGAVL